ncbi:hypothetical protein [Pseudomonas savastanoi]|uniref:hypothetical protein n=1 Tax=Pseudomonas savastanoi TaxID=29438 RepID=UPI001F20E82F|nr:hypothetical protein [Pseudomonas savastanoi]
MKTIFKVAACICAITSSVASAADNPDDDVLISGTITNKTRATAVVEFKQPITLINTLTASSGLKAENDPDSDTQITIATGQVRISESGASARLAILSTLNERAPGITTYAEGHEGDADYALMYSTAPGTGKATLNMLNDYSMLLAEDGSGYFVSKKDISSLDYGVVATPPKKAGKYTIQTVAGVYVP